MNDIIQKQKSYEVLELHKYKVMLSAGETLLAFPYIKISSILKIFMGTSGEFRDLIKSMFSRESVGSGNLSIDKIAVLHNALDMLNTAFAASIVDAFTEVVDIALTEYDQDGNIAKQGNCRMMSAEDVNIIFRVVLTDLGEVLKNVFGMEATQKKISEKEKPLLSQIKKKNPVKAPTEAA